MSELPPERPDEQPPAAEPSSTQPYPAAAGDAWTMPSGHYPGEPPPPVRRSRAGLVVGGVALALALIAAGGVFAASRMGGVRIAGFQIGGGAQPEEVAPRSTFAIAKVDLDPPLAQKRAVRNFASKFPSAPKAEAADIFDAFVQRIVAESGKLNYETDVKPWLGKRAAVAGFFDASGKPQVLGVLQVKDEDKAKATFDKGKGATGSGPTAYRFVKDYALLAETQATVDAAVQAADREALADNPDYGKDLDQLNQDQIVVGWIDGPAAARATGALGRLGGLGGALPSGALLGAGATSGRSVVGLHATDNYLELEGFSSGTTAGLTPARPEIFGNLPADTVAAITVNNLGAGLQQALTGAAALGGLGGLPFSPLQLLQDFETKYGISVQRDLIPLFQREAVAAFGSVPGLEEPKVGLVTQVADEQGARVTAAKLQRLATSVDLAVQHDVSNQMLFLTTGVGYLDTVKSGRGLASSASFTTAMGDLGESVSVAVYVDLARVLTLAQDQSAYRDLRALKALGMSAGVAGGKSYFRLRVVAG